MLEQKTLINALGLQSSGGEKELISLEDVGDMAIKKTSCGGTLLQLACRKKPSLEEWENLYRFFDDGGKSLSLPDGLMVHLGCSSFGSLCVHIFSASTMEQHRDVLPILENIVTFCRKGKLEKKYA